MKFWGDSKLRDINYNDLPLIFNWRNQENIRSVMLNNSPIDWLQHLDWFNKYEKDTNTLSKVFYYNDIPYGVLNIKGLSNEIRCCEWGFYIGERKAPKGLGTLLGYTSLNYIFDELEFDEIKGQVVDTNHKSIKFHEKLGFIKVKKEKSHQRYKETKKDLIVFRLTKKQWEIKKETIKELIEGRLL